MTGNSAKCNRHGTLVVDLYGASVKELELLNWLLANTENLQYCLSYPDVIEILRRASLKNLFPDPDTSDMQNMKIILRINERNAGNVKLIGMIDILINYPARVYIRSRELNVL